MFKQANALRFDGQNTQAGDEDEDSLYVSLVRQAAKKYEGCPNKYREHFIKLM